LDFPILGRQTIPRHGCFSQAIFLRDVQLSAGQIQEIDAADVFGPAPANSLNGLGEIKCWAVDSLTPQNQIKWNYLSGTANVVHMAGELAGTAYQYNAWAFKVDPVSALALGSAVGTGGNIRLNGIHYDACPRYWIGQYFTDATIGVVNTDLTLAPCKEDLREINRPTYTKAVFSIETQTEIVYSGADQCLLCWFEASLQSVNQGGLFNSPNLNGTSNNAGRFFVTGKGNSPCPPVVTPAGSSLKCPNGSVPTSILIGGSSALVCSDSTVNSPLLGLLVEEIQVPAGTGQINLTASSGFTSGIDTTGYILWDRSGSIEIVSHPVDCFENCGS
jgi:hypothetical protein